MIDAAFYEDVSVPDEWKELFPDWLVAIGLKVQKDLLDEVSRAEDQAGAVESVKAYLAERGLRLLEPIQVSVRAGQASLYHDWMPLNRQGRGSTPVRTGAPYAFLHDLATGRANFCMWADATANNIRSVARMHRQNLGLVARAERLGVQVIVELHWGAGFARFEKQVAHLRALVRPIQVEVVDASQALVDRLFDDPSELYRIGPERFEDLVQNRIAAMGFATRRTGRTFSKDGGVDLLFWKNDAPFPFLAALQAKYHWSPDIATGARDVRDFAGTLRTLPIAVGVLVTNTGFSFDARWIGTKLGSQLRLRDGHDLRNWIKGRFVDVGDWREIPEEIELCPGVRIRIPKGGITSP
jgi:hypothetical protein